MKEILNLIKFYTEEEQQWFWDWYNRVNKKGHLVIPPSKETFINGEEVPKGIISIMEKAIPTMPCFCYLEDMNEWKFKISEQVVNKLKSIKTLNEKDFDVEIIEKDVVDCAIAECYSGPYYTNLLVEMELCAYQTIKRDCGIYPNDIYTTLDKDNKTLILDNIDYWQVKVSDDFKNKLEYLGEECDLDDFVRVVNTDYYAFLERDLNYFGAMMMASYEWLSNYCKKIEICDLIFEPNFDDKIFTYIDFEYGPKKPRYIPKIKDNADDDYDPLPF